MYPVKRVGIASLGWMKSNFYMTSLAALYVKAYKIKFNIQRSPLYRISG